MEINAVDTAELLFGDSGSTLYRNTIVFGDVVALYYNYDEVNSPLDNTDLRFYGFVEDMLPNLGPSGDLLMVKCRSYFRCLLDMVVAQQYGDRSINDNLDTASEILTDATIGIIPEYVNDILDTGVTSGYSLDTTYVEPITGAIPYLHYPYKPARDAINDLTDILSAVKGSGTAGAHWIGKTVESPADTFTNYFCLAQVANHELAGAPAVETVWPTYWNTNQANSTITVKQDMLINAFEQRRAEANYIIYMGTYWFPADGDWLTEDKPAGGAGGEASWGAVDMDKSDSVAQQIVGSHSLLLEPNNSPNQGIVYYPSTKDAAWDFSVISTPRNIPRLVWYEYGNNVAVGGYPIYMATDESTLLGGGADDYFWISPSQWITYRADKWNRMELPFGPHYALDPRFQRNDGGDEFEWNITGNADWTDINFVAILLEGNNAFDRYIDGFHIEGHVIRVAQKAGETYTKMKVITDRVAKDDTLTSGTPGTTDTGTMARVALAELLRSSRRPITGTIRVPWKPTMLPGQVAHIHAAAYSGGYRIDRDMRIMELRQILSMGGADTYVTLTDDLLNSRPMSPNDAYNIVRAAGDLEYQNRQVSSVKGWTIDLDQTRLVESYTFNDDYD
jgi:hypothetical protein